MQREKRDQAVERIQGLSTIYGEEKFIYKISHFYDIIPFDAFVSVNIAPENMQMLVASIQFLGHEMDHSFSLDQRDVVKLIKKHFNGKTVSKKAKESQPVYKIDLFENWEDWCGRAGELVLVEGFELGKIVEDLKKIVEGDKNGN